jgi:hypothetical protein
MILTKAFSRDLYFALTILLIMKRKADWKSITVNASKLLQNKLQLLLLVRCVNNYNHLKKSAWL